MFALSPDDHGTSTNSGVVERHSIDYIPRTERRGRVWHQGPFWFTGNFVLPTMVVGFIGPSMGLSAAWSALAVVLGACFGTFFMAFHANQVPRMGLPQMIQSRAQFGSRGVILPFAATVFVYLGFMVFDVILAEQGLGLLLPGSKWFWYPSLTALSIVIALAIPTDYLDSFNDFVILMLYFLVPWTAVNLVDFYFVRHGRYAITEIFNPNGIYGRWAWRGIVSYLIGFAAMVPFFSTTFYTGAGAEAFGGADISFVFGLTFSGGLYYLLARGQERSVEEDAYERSDRTLREAEVDELA